MRRRAIEAAGATLCYLPPYWPDFNPIENAFSRLKAYLRKAAARTIDELWDVIRNALLMAGIDSNWQGTFVGVFLVAAVYLGKLRAKQT